MKAAQITPAPDDPPPTRVGTMLPSDLDEIAFAGSPPRVWGRSPVSSSVGEGARFTPTRVGTIFLRRFFYLFVTVHPHACGDDASAATSARARGGSPPRVWGRLVSLGGRPGPGRFTPTRVGTILANSAFYLGV